nr:DUF4279 domain-containing protein [Chengkuizengella sediminis]
MAYFSLFGDSFPLEKATKKLGITPTKTYKKGDRIRDLSITRKVTCWDLSTDYQESFDVNEQLDQIIKQIQEKDSIINEIRKTYSVECKFTIVIIIEEGYTPALYLNNEVIKFASSIDAEFDIDLYANPYIDDMDY